MELTNIQREIALLIFAGGGIQFGGFKLKMHKVHPDAPLSPIYINLRGKPKGNFSDKTLAAFGHYLADHAVLNNITIFYDCVVGLPKAGEPLADGFIEAFKLKPTKIQLKKEKGDNKRKIVPVVHGDFEQDDNTLMIDDLITKADTKLEGAQALRDNGLVVTDCLVLVDREQGGEAELAKAGINLHAVVTLTQLLDFYLEVGLIDEATKERVVNYRQAVEDYLASKKGE